MSSLKRQANVDVRIESPLLTGREAAAYLKIGKSTLYELVKRNEIPVTYVGKTMRFIRAELDKKFCSVE